MGEIVEIPFSAQLRAKVRDHDLRKLSEASGVPQSTLYRFASGGTLTMKNIDRLMRKLKLGIKEGA